jgi:hypothetical protein
VSRIILQLYFNKLQKEREQHLMLFPEMIVRLSRCSLNRFLIT